jgi:hypothetical protein
MRLKDLKPSHDLRKGLAAVLLPRFHRLLALHEDDEVVVVPLVDGLGLHGISARHFGGAYVRRGGS